MPEIVLSNTNNFTALENGSVESGSFIPNKWNFSTDNTGTGLNDFTKVDEVSAKSIDIVDGECRIECDEVATMFNNGPGVSLPLCANGDFDFRFTLSSSNADQNYEYTGLYAVFGVNEYVQLSAGQVSQINKRTGGANTFIEANAITIPCDMRITRTGDTFRWYYDLGGGFSEYHTEDIVFGDDVSLEIRASTHNTSGTLISDIDDVLIYDGGVLSGKVQIHTDGLEYIEIPPDNHLDFTNFDFTYTGTPTITFDYYLSNNNLDTPTYTENLTLNQIRSLGEVNYKYLWLRANVDGNPEDSLDSITIHYVEGCIVLASKLISGLNIISNNFINIYGNINSIN